MIIFDEEDDDSYNPNPHQMMFEDSSQEKGDIFNPSFIANLSSLSTKKDEPNKEHE
jgi:hypothetical protein